MNGLESPPLSQGGGHTRGEIQEIESLMCSLHRVAEDLHEKVEGTRRRAGPHIVDFDQFEARTDRISTMRLLHAQLQKLTAAVAQYGQAADLLHQEEITSMQKYINQTPHTAEGVLEPPQANGTRAGVPWKDEAMTARIFGRGGSRPPPEPARSAPPRPNPPERRMVMLGEGVSLDARIVPETIKDPRDILAAVSTPELYYIPRWDHFAVRCGAVVFHGNVGRIYPPAGRLSIENVKECRHRSRCPSLAGPKAAACSYYHSPGECPGSRDVRNFIADSWVYDHGNGARYGSRQIGDRESLCGDLQRISETDSRRHLAQTTQDILISIILEKYVLGKRRA